MKSTDNHTWNIFIAYHRCPECGYITESRNGYELVDGKEQKEIACERCSHAYTVIRVRREKKALK